MSPSREKSKLPEAYLKRVRYKLRVSEGVMKTHYMPNTHLGSSMLSPGVWETGDHSKHDTLDACSHLSE